MRYHSSCTSGKAAIARGDELAMQVGWAWMVVGALCFATCPSALHTAPARCPSAVPLLQANRFYPTDPFTSTDPNPNYDSRQARGTPGCCVWSHQQAWCLQMLRPRDRSPKCAAISRPVTRRDPVTGKPSVEIEITMSRQ